MFIANIAEKDRFLNKGSRCPRGGQRDCHRSDVTRKTI